MYMLVLVVLFGVAVSEQVSKSEDVKQLREEMRRLQDLVQEQQALISGLQGTVAGLQQTAQDQGRIVHAHSQAIGQLKASVNGSRDDVVGFTAFATETRNYDDADQVVHFDGVITDFGGHYDFNSSVFLCPHQGAYLFSVNVLSPYEERMYVEILQEGREIGSTWADDVDPAYQQASLTVITECAAGESVYVNSGSGCWLYGSQSETLSTFTGYMLLRFA